MNASMFNLVETLIIICINYIFKKSVKNFSMISFRTNVFELL